MLADRDSLTFSHFSMDTRRRVLLAHGQPVRLHARAFDVLEFLVENRDQPVSREAIIAHVWGGRSISPGSLSVQLSAVRKALEAAGAAEPLILTLPDQRYRFVGECGAPGLPPAPELPPYVMPPPPVAAAQPRRLRLSIFAAAALVCLALLVAGLQWRRAAAPAAPRLSMVVLPFRNLSADREQDFQAVEITEDLTCDLAHVPGATIIARESAEAVKEATPQNIGRELHVRYVLSGTIRPEDGTTTIAVHLTDTQTGAHLWSDNFTAARGGMAAVRFEIVRHIASALHFELDALENEQSIRDRPNNPDALDLFFRAPAQCSTGIVRPTGSKRRRTCWRLRIRLQPDFVDAKAELGWALLRKVQLTDDPKEDDDFTRAKTVIAEALSASPTNAKALAAHARQLEIDGKCSQANVVAQQLVAGEPSNVEGHIVLARCAQADMRLQQASAEYELATKLDPYNPANPIRYISLGYLSLMQGDFQKSAQFFAQVGGETRPNDPFSAMSPDEQAQLGLMAAETT